MYLQIPVWPFERGVFAPQDIEELGAYADLVSLANHGGKYSPLSKGWCEPGELHVSERFLALRWEWNKSKVHRLLLWALEHNLFLTRPDTAEGRWLKVWEGGEIPEDLGGWYFFDGEVIEEKPKKVDFGATLDQVAFPPHLDTFPVREAIQKFCSYRRVTLKKPIKSAGPINIILNRFKARSAAVLIAAIDHSIEQEWQSVFEPKTFGKKNPNDAHAANLELIESLRRGG